MWGGGGGGGGRTASLSYSAKVCIVTITHDGVRMAEWSKAHHFERLVIAVV